MKAISAYDDDLVTKGLMSHTAYSRVVLNTAYPTGDQRRGKAIRKAKEWGLLPAGRQERTTARLAEQAHFALTSMKQKSLSR